MRAFVVFTILGVALGRNLCRGVKKSEIRKAHGYGRWAANFFLGASCPSFDIDRVVFENGECKHLVKQAICYSINAVKLYNVEVVNYDQLRTDVPNMESLGNLACEKTRACFQEVKAALEVCLEDNVEFLSQTIDAVENNMRGLEESFATFAKKKKGSLFGDLVNMAMQQFSSADIRSFIEGELIDAMKAEEEAHRLVQEWCDSGCTSKTAKFLRGLFRKMHGGQCTDASVFCGACATRADKFFEKTALPCCVEEVVYKSFEIHDKVVQSNEDGNDLDTIFRHADAISAELSHDINLSLLVLLGSAGAQSEEGQMSQESTDDHEAMIEIMKDRLEEEFDCVKNVYLENKPVCE